MAKKKTSQKTYCKRTIFKTNIKNMTDTTDLSSALVSSNSVDISFSIVRDSGGSAISLSDSFNQENGINFDSNEAALKLTKKSVQFNPKNINNINKIFYLGVATIINCLQCNFFH